MSQPKLKQQPQVDMKSTTKLTTPDNNVVFQQGVILRKVSKFLISANEDGIIPIPVFYDVVTKKILIDTLPVELRNEYKEYTF